ncbi:MAG: DUF2279 domain-containing protein [Cyclobacteriaceae bacterium]
MARTKSRDIRLWIGRLLLCTAISLSLGPFQVALGQEADTLNKVKLRKVVIASSSVYAATMIGLDQVWYSDFDKQPFSFFNDSKEWLQIDKAGHLYSAFHIADVNSRSLQWSGMGKRKSNNIGAVASFLMLSSIEIFDGYSSGYGASASDLVANALGVSLFLGQQALWDEARIRPKFSFHTTYLANLRPAILGSTFNEKLIKDYNGQTYWLSVDVDKFTPFPKWLNLAVGYGAHDQIFATDQANVASGFTPYRQYYVALDFDATAIKTRSKGLKTLLYFVNMIKLPAPTLELSNGQIKAHAFYF